MGDNLRRRKLFIEELFVLTPRVSAYHIVIYVLNKHRVFANKKMPHRNLSMMGESGSIT
jgi:hypothetical protein